MIWLFFVVVVPKVTEELRFKKKKKLPHHLMPKEIKFKGVGVRRKAAIVMTTLELEH